jgi:hypothetical protein
MHCNPSEISECVKLINDDLCRLYAWSVKHGLKLSPNKSQAIIFSQVSSVKNSSVYSRAMTPVDTRIRLINTLVLPIFDYCAVVMCNINENLFDRLQIVQNNCVRYVFNLKRYDHVTPFHCKLGWLKIRERFDLQLLVMSHKILNGYTPNYLASCLTVMSDVHTRSTRSHPLYLRAPFVGKSVPDKSFSVLAYRLRNNLKPNLCSTMNTGTFPVNIESLLSKKYLRPKL